MNHPVYTTKREKHYYDGYIVVYSIYIYTAHKRAHNLISAELYYYYIFMTDGNISLVDRRGAEVRAI